MIFCDRAVYDFLSMAQGGTANVLDFVNIPVSIVLGILLGGIFGFLLCLFFETAYAKNIASETV